MPLVNVIGVGTLGVDMRANPLLMDSRKLRFLGNMQISEGVVQTRPSINYLNLQTPGQFQGAVNFSPSKGLSYKPFADEVAALTFVVNGSLYAANVDEDGCITCAPHLVCEAGAFQPDQDVTLFQAENYLIAQSFSSNTYWWTGEGCLTASPGLGDCETITDNGNESLSDTRQHYLINGAGQGIYVHGRIHQDAGRLIYVSDIIHKRGYRSSDDILSMEEQMTASYGQPLSTNSDKGFLLAMEVLPRTNTPHGEGDLIAYYENGVVSHNTFEFPRESRYDADGKQITKGWDTKRLTNTLLNRISAVGRYAVAVLPRDHFFRSMFGLHFLKKTVGTETVNDEPLNHEAHDVQKLLDSDNPNLLFGNTTGYWLKGNRLFSTIGLRYDKRYSSASSGRGFVSLNRAYSFNQNNTPVPTWEGLWAMDAGMWGIHKFLGVGINKNVDGFGFIASDTNTQNFFSYFGKNTGLDIRDGKTIPIKWSIETSYISGKILNKSKEISDGRLEIISRKSNTSIKVYIRTDKQLKWGLWRELKPCEGDANISEALGKPVEAYREGTWFQFKIEGNGHVEIFGFDVDLVAKEDKAGKSRCSTQEEVEEDYFKFIES